MTAANHSAGTQGTHQEFAKRGWGYRISRRFGIGVGFFLVLAFLFVGGILAAGIAADLDQCANGTSASPLPCSGAQWQNGNVNSNQAHWKEGDSLPYRMKLTGLSTSSTSYTLVIGWNVTASSKHAIDYITSFDRTESQANGNNPCSGQTCSLSNVATLAIPPDPLAPPNCGAIGGTQIAGLMSLFYATGKTATITDFSGYYLLSGSTYTPATCAGIGASSENTIAIHFTTNDPAPVMAWGGHIATQFDWGAGNSAGAIPGSPYHAHLEGFCVGTLNPGECTDGGSQDRSLQAGAVTFVSMTTQRNPDTTIPPGGSVSDTASLTGNNSTTAPTGTVTFYICYKFTSNPTDYPPCSSTANADLTLGNPFDSKAVVTSNNTGTATSNNFTSSNLGTYCFLAIYTSSNPLYANVIANITSANQTQECFSLQGATAVTLSSFAGLADPNGSANIMLKWTTGSEVQTAGFNIYRSEQADGPYTRINAQLIPAAQDQVAGGSYQFTDQNIAAGKTYYYQLEDVEFAGTGTRHAPVAVTVANDATRERTIQIAFALGIVAVGGAGLVLISKRMRQRKA